MPKILINEKNRTSAGTPGRYGNFSVLIAGYMGTPDPAKVNDAISPDENGVYEFNSVGEFLATIGRADTKKTVGTEVSEYHYGNRMAEELLNMGYQVIYRVINKVSDMDDFENFWAIFKDKANYDFRFISHGLLETCYDAEEHTDLYTRKNEIETDLKKIEEIVKKAEETDAYKTATTDIAKTEAINTVYLQTIKAKSEGGEGYTGFVDNAGATYSSYTLAIDETSGLPFCKTDIEAKIEEHNDKYVTIDVFNNINGHIAKLASYRTTDDNTTVLCDGRGDCTALIELDEDTYCEADPTKRPEILIREGISNMASKIGDDGKFCAMTVPSVYCKTGGDEPEKFPGAFYYLACFMSSLGSGFAEWYAAAGYTRGVSSYAVDHTSVKLGEIAINVLEPRSGSKDTFACNVIANFRGSYYLWGNRTAAPLGEDLTADHFLNIRQLCSTIKKQLYVACRRFTFDPNSDTLWFNFVNAITPTLDAMRADQGISDYRIIKVTTDKKATLKAKIRIIPIEAVEDFDLEVSLEDSFGETSAVVTG